MPLRSLAHPLTAAEAPVESMLHLDSSQQSYLKLLAALASALHTATSRLSCWQENQGQDAWTQLQILEPVLDMVATDQSVRVVSQVHPAPKHWP